MCVYVREKERERCKTIFVQCSELHMWVNIKLFALHIKLCVLTSAPQKNLNNKQVRKS